MTARKTRVLCFIVRYPAFSETYMHEEIRSLGDRYDIDITTYTSCEDPRRDPFPYTYLPYEDVCPVFGRFNELNLAFTNPAQRAYLEAVDRLIEERRPDVLHAHYFGLTPLLNKICERHGLQYTLRTHSMDMLSEPQRKVRALCAAAARPTCRRLLTFPRFSETLVQHGVPAAKVTACWPVLNYARFRATDVAGDVRGRRVMCAGPFTEKKRHTDFVDLAVLMRGSGFTFDLYGTGYWLEKTRAHNVAAGNPVTIRYVDPDDMVPVYREHDWVVYTSDTKINKVGLPVTLMEAQASGLGICWQELPGRREEQLEFLGGAGYLFQSIDEVPAILKAGYPEAMRTRGLQNSRKCDIEGHRHLLSEAWDAVCF
jgi:hypothetical protein